MNNFRIRSFITLVIAFALAGCVSTSLEDAAPTEPTSLTVVQPAPAVNTQIETTSTQTVSNSVQSPAPAAQTSDTSVTVVDSSAVPQKPSDEEFPTFAQDRRGETNQMTPEEKAAIETQMTELLLERETDPRIRARYLARLRYLRNLAKTHAADTTAKISQ
jgi:hypothetical protein